MGLRCAHIHLRGVTPDKVLRVYQEEMPDRTAFITPAINDWVTVFDAEHLGCDTDEFLGDMLCRHCKCPGVILKVLHSDLLFYRVFDESGKVVDNADFEDFEDLTADEKCGLGGNPDVLAKLCPGVTGDQIRDALKKKHVFRDDNLYALARLLQIEHVGVDYDSCEDESGEDSPFDDDPAWQGFIHIVGE